MRGTFEFDQPYKQTESKMQVTGKISSNTVCLIAGGWGWRVGGQIENFGKNAPQVNYYKRMT